MNMTTKNTSNDVVAKDEERNNSANFCLSSSELLKLNTTKSLIAELRPTRRKLQWKNHQVADWTRTCHTNNTNNTNIRLEERLQWCDLGIGTGQLQPTTRAAHKLDCDDASSVASLKQAIRKATKQIEQVKQETRTNQERIQQVQDEIAHLRHDLGLQLSAKAITSFTANTKVVDDYKLWTKKRALDEQLGMLQTEKHTLLADMDLARELVVAAAAGHCSNNNCQETTNTESITINNEQETTVTSSSGSTELE
jgi:hypothetical protein